MCTKTVLILLTFGLAVQICPAQPPAPVVVQAIVPGAPAVAPSAPVSSSTAPVESALKTLLEIKAANEELLRKQAATLQQLEEMEKAADQIKIYTKRG